MRKGGLDGERHTSKHIIVTTRNSVFALGDLYFGEVEEKVTLCA